MSLTLAATDTITGVAGSATAITYTIFGDEVAAGADAFKVLAQGQLPSAVGTLYTVPASTEAIVKAIHLVNGTASPVTARLNVKGTAAANAILPAITLLAGGFAVYADDGWRVYNDQGQLLSVGATGATGATGAAGAAGATGAAGADGLATTGTPAVVLSTTAAAGVAATALATDAQIIAFDATVPVTQAFGDAAAAGTAAVTARRDHKHAMPTSPLGLPLGLTGAVTATRYVGGTASVAPTTGTFAVGDYVITAAGSIYICTVAGTPGTWVAVSGGSGAVATDTIWDAVGDTVVGSGANTAVKRMNNDGAAVAPTVNDDSGDGYSIGSRWLDTTADKEYVCLDATTTAAVWVETTATGGGGSTIKYGGLKPATPLDDFAGASLDGAWSAHSSQGAFATTDCYTQALDGSHLSMGFQAKNGRLYRAATNVDQEWIVGGIVPDGGLLTGIEPMFGIALVNTSGTGSGIIVYNDGNAYVGGYTSWTYGGSAAGTFTGFGHNLLRNGPYALRIVRVGNVFTGYISIDGQAWVAASATHTTAITVAHKSVGVVYNPAQSYRGRLFVDWVHTV